jgi:hypothetical protein
MSAGQRDMPPSVRLFDSGSLSSVKPLPRSFDSVSASLPEYLRPDRAPPPPSFASCKSQPVYVNSLGYGSRYPPPPSTDLPALESLLKNLHDVLGLFQDEHIQMRQEWSALQAERLDHEHIRQKEALVLENLRKDMDRREEETARQLKEARDREDARFKNVKHFVELSLEGVKLTAPQSQGTPVSSQAKVLSSALLSQPSPPIAESPDYPSTIMKARLAPGTASCTLPSSDRATPISHLAPFPLAPVHPPDQIKFEAKEKAMLHDVWNSLIEGDPHEVAALYRDSPFYETVLQVLLGKPSPAGDIWHRRVYHLSLTINKWLAGRVVVNDAKDNSLHFQMLRLAELNNMKFPIQSISSTPDIAAKAWDSFRLSLIRKVEDALSLSWDSVEIFRALIVSTLNVDIGNSKRNAFLLELVEDTFLNLNSLLACDVLLRQLDQSFAQGADGFSQFSSSIAWNRLLERQPSVDFLQLAKTLTRAYIEKQGDRAGIDMNIVWNAPHMKHDINERFYQVRGNDLQSSARSLDNAMKYKELLCEANTRAQCAGARPFESSCIHICQFFLAPYESSRKDLYKND